MSDLEKVAEIRPLEEVRHCFRGSPIVSVSNRSTIQLATNGNKTVEIRRSPGGLGPSVGAALRLYGNALIYATAMTDAEKAVAAKNVLVSQGDTIWVRYVLLPQHCFAGFYDDWANLLCMLYHAMPEKLIPIPTLSQFIRHPAAWMRYGMSRLLASFGHQHVLNLPVRDLVCTRQMQHAYEQGYRWVNQTYADILVRELPFLENPRVLVNDFHFSLLPALLRNHGFTGRIAFFLHVPWPAPAIFRSTLPLHIARDIIGGMLGSNVVGFQISADVEKFKETAMAVLGDNIRDQSNYLIRVDYPKYMPERVELLANPIIVDPNLIQTAATSAIALDFIQQLRHKIGDRILIVRAERIDVIKGIMEGLSALRLMLRFTTGHFLEH